MEKEEFKELMRKQGLYVHEYGNHEIVCGFEKDDSLPCWLMKYENGNLRTYYLVKEYDKSIDQQFNGCIKLKNLDKESIENRIKEQKKLYNELQKKIKIEKIKELKNRIKRDFE